MDKDIAIEFRHVTKIYTLFRDDKQRLRSVFFKGIRDRATKIKALNDINFQVHKGEAVALLGRNGAGKSTLLKMSTGVAYPTKGEIEVDGRVSALLELTAGFDPEFTGRENIYFRGQLMGMKEEEIARLEPAIVEFAEIGEYMDQPVRTYSSGMKARLGFAINVNVEPEILIVDEALSVGDASFRKKCTEKVNELIMGSNITFLLVTHSSKTAQLFCQRGIVMKKGTMIFDSDIDSAVKYYDDMIAKEDAARKERRRKKRAQELADARAAAGKKQNLYIKIKNKKLQLQADDYKGKTYELVKAIDAKVCYGYTYDTAEPVPGATVEVDADGLDGFDPRHVRAGVYKLWFVGKKDDMTSAPHCVDLTVYGKQEDLEE